MVPWRRMWCFRSFERKLCFRLQEASSPMTLLDWLILENESILFFVHTGGEVKEKLANVVGSQYPSHYLGTWCIHHYYRWCRTPLLPAVDWTDAPADLNGLVRFAERRNLVSERVCHHISNVVYHILRDKNPFSLSLFVSLWWDSFGRRQACRKASTWTGQHRHKTPTHVHMFAGIWTRDPIFRCQKTLQGYWVRSLPCAQYVHIAS